MHDLQGASVSCRPSVPERALHYSTNPQITALLRRRTSMRGRNGAQENRYGVFERVNLEIWVIEHLMQRFHHSVKF